MTPRVCALVPHHDCHEWLAGAIESLLGQTRPADAVVVLDDASAQPPLEVAARFPSVTFLRAPENVGPYRMLQTVVDRTDFDAYLFQDADDLSHPERLATLLEVASARQADIVGSHEVEIDAAAPEARTREYPLDVNAALSADPIAFALLHPSSLVSRDAVGRAGGFPGGLRFSGDVDFLWRAGHCARIVNADRHLYFRRRHSASLTGSAATGTRSFVRRQLDAALRERARANARRVATGHAPDRSPFASAPPVAFEHLAGPELGAASATRRRSPERRAGGDGPVLVIGGPRNGGDVLAWALDLHPAFDAVPDLAALDGRAPGTGSRAVAAGPVVTVEALTVADRFPDAKFVCVERDVESTVASLVARPDAHGDFYSEDLARTSAVELATTVDLLAAALGPDRLLRVQLARLLAHPDAALADVLAFLGAWRVTAPTLLFAGLPVLACETPPLHSGVAAATARRLLEERRPAVAPPLPARLLALVSGHLDDRSVVAVVSRGDDSLVELGAGRAWHFPGSDDGSYAGEYPPTGRAAVALLEDVRGRGATHLLVPAPATWWLTYYDELRVHLDRRYRVVAGAEDTGSLYDLAEVDSEATAQREARAG